MNSLDVANELDVLYKGLIVLPKDDPNEIIDELVADNGWLARSSVLRAEAQAILDRKRGIVADHHNGENATRIRIILEAECADEQRLVNLADKLDRTLTYRIDTLRSFLSFQKELIPRSTIESTRW